MADNFAYRFDEKLGGIVIEKYTGASDVVVIPSEINGYPVVGIYYDFPKEFYETLWKGYYRQYAKICWRAKRGLPKITGLVSGE